jgi:hypothetical protein
MGIFDDLFGGNREPVRVEQTQTPDPWVRGQAMENYDLTKGLTSKPYQPYGGTRVSPFSDTKLKAFDMIEGGAGSYKPFYDSAGMMTKEASGVITPSMMQAYLNPFMDEVVSRGSDEIMRNRGIINRQNTQRAVSTGNYGGSRHGVVESENNRNALRAIADMTSTMGAAGWDKAITANQTDLARKIQAAQQLMAMGTGTQAAGLRDAAAVGAIGAEEEAQAQKGLDIDYEDYLRQYAFPFDMLKYRQDMLAGNASTPSSATTAPTLQPSVAGQLLGIGLTLPQLLQALGGN